MITGFLVLLRGEEVVFMVEVNNSWGLLLPFLSFPWTDDL